MHGRDVVTNASHEDRVARQKAHFDSIAREYDEARQNENHLQLKALIWRQFFKGAVAFGANLDGADRPLTVLEAMCGYADGKAILESHLARPIEYAGFDYSDTVVDEMRVRSPELKIWRQDVTRFDSERRYDLIMVLGGLHHVPHAANNVVARLASALEPGGYFINLEPTHGNRLFRYARERVYARNALFDEQTEQAFVIGDYVKMFQAAGLEQAYVIYPGLLSYVLYYNPDAFPALNVGSTRIVRALFALEKPFLRTRLARALSFATLSLWRRPV